MMAYVTTALLCYEIWFDLQETVGPPTVLPSQMTGAKNLH